MSDGRGVGRQVFNALSRCLLGGRGRIDVTRTAGHRSYRAAQSHSQRATTTAAAPFRPITRPCWSRAKDARDPRRKSAYFSRGMQTRVTGGKRETASVYGNSSVLRSFTNARAGVCIHSTVFSCPEPPWARQDGTRAFGYRHPR